MHVEEWHQFEFDDPRVRATFQVGLKVADEGRPPWKKEKLALREVCKYFPIRTGSIEVLSKISLSVSEGEFVCLVGPSGCGKSTLLNIIAGLERPSSGDVLADGRSIIGAGAERLVMFQEPALFPWLNVRQNVEFGLKMKGVPRAERSNQAMNGLRLVGLADFACSYVHQLSGGMKQRAALARALVLNPDLLLLDEPFAALDAQTRDVLHDELLSVWVRTGKTIIFVTHNVQEALRLADRIVVFSARPGRVVREFLVAEPRPRPVERGALCEIGEAIRHELRLALNIPPGEVESGARRSQEGPILSDIDCPLGTGG